MILFSWRKDAEQAGHVKADTGDSPDKACAGEAGDEPSTSPGAPWIGAVRGERTPSGVGGARSLQSRMSSLLAAGLMISVGASMLTWYYLRALSRPATARAPAHAALPEAAGAGMTVPPFGPVPSQPVSRPVGSIDSAPSVPPDAARQVPALAQASLPGMMPLDRLLGPPLDRSPAGLPRGYRAPQPSPGQPPGDRRLAGEVFTAEGGGVSTSITARPGTSESGAPLQLANVAERVPPRSRADDPLTTLLRPRVLMATEAEIVGTQRLLLPKGAFIDCTLETAIDSTLPGMTTCITATDTFGADGTVVLLERGTKLIGETRSEVHQGEARVFVAWMEARTPSGIVVQLDSPGTDALGRSGLEGTVNRHFWQRFGAAALVSTIDGVVQSEAQSSSRGGTVVLDPTASADVLAQILRSTVNIPPTLRVRNGARVQVLVARDLDFRTVYELESP